MHVEVRAKLAVSSHNSAGRNKLISNGNRTEWSIIQGVIGGVISNRSSA